MKSSLSCCCKPKLLYIIHQKNFHLEKNLLVTFCIENLTNYFFKTKNSNQVVCIDSKGKLHTRQNVSEMNEKYSKIDELMKNGPMIFQRIIFRAILSEIQRISYIKQSSLYADIPGLSSTRNLKRGWVCLVHVEFILWVVFLFYVCFDILLMTRINAAFSSFNRTLSILMASNLLLSNISVRAVDFSLLIN